jgi:hypothetical protein
MLGVEVPLTFVASTALPSESASTLTLIAIPLTIVFISISKPKDGSMFNHFYNLNIQLKPGIISKG